MIADPNVAKNIAEALLDVSGRIDASVEIVRDKCSDAELVAYRRAAGEVLGGIYDHLLKPLYAAHPELKPKGVRDADA